MSDAGRTDDSTHWSSLPRDLTRDQLDAAPILESPDALVIEELSQDEDDAFAAALAG